MQVCFNYGHLAATLLSYSFCPTNSGIPKKLWKLYREGVTNGWIGRPVNEVQALMSQELIDDLADVITRAPRCLLDPLFGPKKDATFETITKDTKWICQKIAADYKESADKLAYLPKSKRERLMPKYFGMTLSNILKEIKTKQPDLWEPTEQENLVFFQSGYHFSTRLQPWLQAVLNLTEAGCIGEYKGLRVHGRPDKRVSDPMEMIHRCDSPRFQYLRDVYTWCEQLVDVDLWNKTDSIEQMLFYWYSAASYFTTPVSALSTTAWAAMFGFQGSRTTTWSSVRFSGLKDHSIEIDRFPVNSTKQLFSGTSYYVTESLKQKRGIYFIEADFDQPDKTCVTFPTPENCVRSNQRKTAGLGKFLPLRPDFYNQLLEVSSVYRRREHLLSAYRWVKDNKLTKDLPSYSTCGQTQCCGLDTSPPAAVSLRTDAAWRDSIVMSERRLSTGVDRQGMAPLTMVAGSSDSTTRPEQECLGQSTSLAFQKPLADGGIQNGCAASVTRQSDLAQNISPTRPLERGTCITCQMCEERQRGFTRKQEGFTEKEVLLAFKSKPMYSPYRPLSLLPSDERFSAQANADRWKAFLDTNRRQSMPYWLFAPRYTVEEKAHIDLQSKLYFELLEKSGSRHNDGVSSVDQLVKHLQDWMLWLWDTGILLRLQDPSRDLKDNWTWPMVDHLVRNSIPQAFRLGEMEEFSLIGNYALGKLPSWMFDEDLRQYMLESSWETKQHLPLHSRNRKSVESRTIQIPVAECGSNWVQIAGWAMECGDMSRSGPAMRMVQTVRTVMSPASVYKQIKTSTSEAKQRMERQWGLIPLLLLHTLSKRFNKQRFEQVFSIHKQTATLNCDKLLAPCLMMYENTFSHQTVTSASINNGNPVLSRPLIVTSSDEELNRSGLLYLYNRTKDERLKKDLIRGLGKAGGLQETLFSWCEKETALVFNAQYESIEQAYDASHKRNVKPSYALLEDFFESNGSSVTSRRGQTRYVKEADL